MKILVTGARGFVGRNLVSQLRNIQSGKAGCYGDLVVDAVYAYDIDSTPEELDRYCKDCDFVFNLAGVNRPQKQEEFMQGNFGFASTLLDTLKKHHNNCPVMISSSIQATLAGRFGTSEYGKSKKAGEELMFKYGEETGAKVLVYRFPNLFGKWCRPNYNSAVATFCHNRAHDLPIMVNDPAVEFLPIHRIVFGVDSWQMLREFYEHYPQTIPEEGEGHVIRWCCKDKSGVLTVPHPEADLAVETLQSFIDSYLSRHGGTVDYIHDLSAVEEMSRQTQTIGFLLPEFSRQALFPYVKAHGALPRKTFSMGEARDKRYYLEMRRIGR